MICARCRKRCGATMMSQYNTQIVCMSCKDAEEIREDYKFAVEAENEAMKRKDFNFKGIGFSRAAEMLKNESKKRKTDDA